MALEKKPSFIKVKKRVLEVTTPVESLTVVGALAPIGPSVQQRSPNGGGKIYHITSRYRNM